MSDLIDKRMAIKIAESYGLNNGTTIGKHSGIADLIAEELSNLPTIEAEPVRHGEWMSEKELTTDTAIKYLESIIYEDFAPYTQKCLLKVIEAARKEASVNVDWEKRMERIVERLEESKTNFSRMGTLQSAYYDKGLDKAIEIVKAGGADE